MKRKTMACAMAGMLISTFACSAQNRAEGGKISVAPDKILIACYSWSGNTKAAAEQIQKATGGTLFEIKPEKPYPENYSECVKIAEEDIKNNMRPALAEDVEDFQDYEVIFIGSPNWWGTIAPPVATFLTAHDFTGKIVIPFFTHGGGGMQNCERTVAKLCSKATLLPAATFAGSSVKTNPQALVPWINSLIEISAAEAPLTEQEQAIVVAAAFAAKGDQINLKKALAAGLDAGVSINEFKEILVQLYAYRGFPYSLNALNTLMTLTKERGNCDKEGELPGTLPIEDSLGRGTANQTKLVGTPVTGELYEFAPAIDEFLKAHLFGDIFSRDNLSWRTRELATIAMLAVAPETEAQLNAHISIGKNNGLTDEQIEEILACVRKNVTGGASTSVFPFGEANVGYAEYFTGSSYLAPLTSDNDLGVPVANVTFEPGCRTHWHKHTGGQLLIVVGGVGYYQERGRAARRLVPGDIVEIPLNVEHWHGAAPDCWFAHLSITCNPENNQNIWLEAVCDEEYVQATAAEK